MNMGGTIPTHVNKSLVWKHSVVSTFTLFLWGLLQMDVRRTYRSYFDVWNYTREQIINDVRFLVHHSFSSTPSVYNNG